MKPHGTIDLETDPFEQGVIPEVFAADFFDGKTHFLFWGPDAAKKAIKAALTFKGLIYAHNGGKFDFHFLMPFLVEIYGAENVEIMTIGSRIVKIKTPGPEFRDSFALIPKPLSAFGNKRSIDINLLKRDRREKNRGEICEYLKQDCLGLWEALAEFFAAYGCEITLASTTFSLLRKEFGIKPPSSSVHHDRKFRPYYFAGRVQFWQLGPVQGETICCDINSAFPWAMTFQHWFSTENAARTSPPKRFREQSFYDIVCDSNGCLPQRGPKREVLFPIGRNLRFFVTGWELFAGIECGLVRNVRFNAIYQPDKCQSFEKYVHHFYKLKQFAPTEAERNFAKLLLNSAYGKFALNCREFKTVRVCNFDTVLPDPWQHSYDDFDTGLSYWQRPSFISDEKTPAEMERAKKWRDSKRTKAIRERQRRVVDWDGPEDGETEPESRPMRFNNVCTAASITGCVRAFLMRSIHKCGGVVYCDTDSIVARDVSKLELGDELGQWKLEKRFDGFWIGGKKLYAGRAHNWRDIEAQISTLEAEVQTEESKAKIRKLKKELWKTASKGVRLTPEQIVRVANGEAQTYAFDAPNFSPYSAPTFTRRTVRRDDQRKRK